MTAHIAYDDVTASLIPSTATFVFYYCDGRYANFSAVKARCPNATFISIAVTASDDAQALDVEPGDATNAEAPGWVKRQRARGVTRPILYTSAGNAEALISECAANGVSRSEYALWTAHYTGKQHVCNSCTSDYPAADGTQFTDAAQGKSLDESLLNDSFFAEVVPTRPPAVKQPTPPAPPAGKQRVPDCRGMSPRNARQQLEDYGFQADGTVGVANTCCYETDPAHWSMLAPGSKVSFTNALPPEITQGSNQTPWNTALQAALTRAGISVAEDGVYGPATDQAVRYFQYEKKLGVDGIVGKNTWDALMNAWKAPAKPDPDAWTFAAPAGLRRGTNVEFPVYWDEVPAHDGTKPTGYTVQAVQMNGKVAAQQVVSGGAATVTLVKGWDYDILVWADGSSSGSPHSTLKVTA